MFVFGKGWVASEDGRVYVRRYGWNRKDRERVYESICEYVGVQEIEKEWKETETFFERQKPTIGLVLGPLCPSHVGGYLQLPFTRGNRKRGRKHYFALQYLDWTPTNHKLFPSETKMEIKSVFMTLSKFGICKDVIMLVVLKVYTKDIPEPNKLDHFHDHLS